MVLQTYPKMQRLKTLLRRLHPRHHEDMSNPTNNDTPKARLPNIQRSSELSKAQTVSEGSHHLTDQHYSSRHERVTDYSTVSRGCSQNMSSFANCDSSHSPGEQTHSKPSHESLYDRDEASRGIMRNSGGICQGSHSNNQTPPAERLGHSLNEKKVDKRRNNPKSLSEEEQTQINMIEDKIQLASVEKPNKDNVEDASSQISREAIPDLANTVDTNETISYAPSVTHQTVRPQVHEIIEEQIHRDIHNHDVYHRIQPVYDVEVLPTRHFVPDPNGCLVEISEDDLPERTSPNQRRLAGARNSRTCTTLVNKLVPSMRSKKAIVILSEKLDETNSKFASYFKLYAIPAV
ncbi:hypothetical protein K449DRAFT_456421 [Hypoxylon sp. EC38]|nr:hypothetical protein K449DRAFT_456421 [Hypoxylon sp. EC38]